MRTIIICLHRGTSVIGRLIRWQTRGGYSHASMILPDGLFVEAREFIGVRALDTLLLAVGHQVRARDRLPRLAVAPGETVETFTVAATAEQVARIEAFVRAQLGKPYDYTMVARFVSRRQASRSSSGKWFCSELVFAALKEAGIVLLRDTEAWEVSPGLLARSPLLTPIP